MATFLSCSLLGDRVFGTVRASEVSVSLGVLIMRLRLLRCCTCLCHGSRFGQFVAWVAFSALFLLQPVRYDQKHRGDQFLTPQDF